jgi:hypothetical protein
MEEESVGGHGAQQGARPAEAVAGRGKGGSWAGPERNSVDFDLQWIFKLNKICFDQKLAFSWSNIFK